MILAVSHTPVDATADSGWLAIASNDPLEAVATLAVTGTAEPPVFVDGFESGEAAGLVRCRALTGPPHAGRRAHPSPPGRGPRPGGPRPLATGPAPPPAAWPSAPPPPPG